MAAEGVSLTPSQAVAAIVELWELGHILKQSGIHVGADILRIIEEKGSA